MSLAYKTFPNGVNYTVRVVNGFDINFKTAARTFEVPEDVAQDKIMLEAAIFQFAVYEMQMHPKAIKMWYCQELTIKE